MLTKHFHLTRVCILPFFNIESGSRDADTYSVGITDMISCFWHFPTQFVHDFRHGSIDPDLHLDLDLLLEAEHSRGPGPPHRPNTRPKRKPTGVYENKDVKWAKHNLHESVRVNGVTRSFSLLLFFRFIFSFSKSNRSRPKISVFFTSPLPL